MEIVTHEQPTRGGLRDCVCPQECPAAIDSLINKCLHEDAKSSNVLRRDNKVMKMDMYYMEIKADLQQ